MVGRDDLGSQIFYDIVGYTDEVLEKANAAAADIQKTMMLPEIEQLSPVRKGEESTVSIKGAQAPVPVSLLTNRKAPKSGGFSKSWVRATIKGKDKETIYAVRNKQYRLVHLLNFDHRHFSHGKYTSDTHQAHAGFVDEVQRHAEEELDRRITDILERS